MTHLLSACFDGGIRMNGISPSDTGAPEGTPTPIHNQSTMMGNNTILTTPSGHTIALRFSPYTTKANSTAHNITSKTFHTQTQNMTGH